MRITEKDDSRAPRLALDNRAGWGQKYLMKRMIPTLLLFVVCGCGPGYDFSPYYGQQQTWQTQSAGYVKVVDKATLYPAGQFPARPYIIIGSVRGGSEGDIAKAVRDQRADAALIFSDQRYRDGSIAMAGPGVVWATPITHTVIKAQLIRYK